MLVNDLLSQPVVSQCGGDAWVFCTQQLHQIVSGMKPLFYNNGKKKIHASTHFSKILETILGKHEKGSYTCII